jgi:hypothetical protein
MTLTLRLIREKLRLPDGLVLIYPYLSRDPSKFESRRKFANDLIVCSTYANILSVADLDTTKVTPW